MSCEAKYAQIMHNLQLKTVQNSTNKYVSGFWCEKSTGDTFSLDEALLWIMDIALKMDLIFFTNNFLLHKTLIDRLESYGLLWCFYSAVWILVLMAPIHFSGSFGEQIM